MIVLGLITCIVLRALTAQAKVVDSFKECKEFFYKGVEPRGMDHNAKKICQKLENGSFHYASLYSVYHKIPLYSAYTLDPGCASTSGSKDIWHLEPQISQHTAQIYHMVRDNQNDSNLYKGNQAISSDYSGTLYDPGHLNPSSFQCSEGRTATFTLTNAAPVDACFNRIHWKNWESKLRYFLKLKLQGELEDGPATAFVVTGTVPNANVRIPKRGTSEEPERVTVPSHIWTAVCYKHHKLDRNSLSFGYIGRNQQESAINLMSVSDLNDQLSRLHNVLTGTIKIFTDDCFGYKNKLSEVMEVFENLINPPVKHADQMSQEIKNMYHAVKRALNTPEKSFKVPGAVECQLVPEKQKTAADGSHCSCIKQSDQSWKCNTGGKTKYCCSSPCLYRDDLKAYKCYSGFSKLIDCSPPYSRITHDGQKCWDNHPCAKYGKGYYWCRVGTDGWFSSGEKYCSPPLRYSKAINGKYCRINHACAHYGKTNTWCYTDDKGNYDLCCTSDDCRSTVNGRTCRSTHPCGYHGKDYLWCFTDNQDNWQYCCTKC